MTTMLQKIEEFIKNHPGIAILAAFGVAWLMNHAHSTLKQRDVEQQRNREAFAEQQKENIKLLVDAISKNQESSE